MDNEHCPLLALSLSLPKDFGRDGGGGGGGNRTDTHKERKRKGGGAGSFKATARSAREGPSQQNGGGNGDVLGYVDEGGRDWRRGFSFVIRGRRLERERVIAMSKWEGNGAGGRIEPGRGGSGYLMHPAPPPITLHYKCTPPRNNVQQMAQSSSFPFWTLSCFILRVHLVLVSSLPLPSALLSKDLSSFLRSP